MNTATKLYRKHSSKPFNPLLANVFFKCGLIEAWGRGFEKIVAGCREYAGPRPSYRISASGVMVLCKACPAYETLKANGDAAGEVESRGRVGAESGKCSVMGSY